MRYKTKIGFQFLVVAFKTTIFIFLRLFFRPSYSDVISFNSNFPLQPDQLGNLLSATDDILFE